MKMPKAVLISIKPKWVEKIMSGEKTIEVRRTAPKEVPFKAYIYATKPKKYYKCGPIITSDELLWLANGKVEIGNGFKFWADGDEYQGLNGRVIGEFICNEIEEFHECELSPQGKFAEFEEERLKKFLSAACLSIAEVVRYRENLPYYKPLYGWHISDVKIYSEPKELSKFKISCNHKNLCYSCNRFTGKPWDICNDTLTRPPQSYMFVEEI